MREVTDDEQVMRQFLLDKLDLEQRAHIEERFLTDNAFKEKLLIAEETLIEDYLDDSLNDAEREQFHSVFLLSPQQREKLTMARALKAVAQAEARSAAPAGEIISEAGGRRTESIESPHEAKGNRRLAHLIAAVLVLVTLIFASVWWIQRDPRERETAETRTTLAIQKQLAELNSDSPSNSDMDSGETVSIVLAPVTTRSAGPPNLLRRTGVAVFELWLLPPSLDNLNFTAMIKKDGAMKQFEVASLPLGDKPQGRAARLRIPAQLFDAGAYQVELWAVSPQGESVFAAEYRFQISE